jgi:hypothetical protein
MSMPPQRPSQLSRNVKTGYESWIGSRCNPCPPEGGGSKSVILLRRESALATTEQVGRAMMQVAKQGGPKHVLESSDISSISSVLHPPATADIESIETNLGAGRGP